MSVLAQAPVVAMLVELAGMSERRRAGVAEVVMQVDEAGRDDRIRAAHDQPTVVVAAIAAGAADVSVLIQVQAAALERGVGREQGAEQADAPRRVTVGFAAVREPSVTAHDGRTTGHRARPPAPAVVHARSASLAATTRPGGFRRSGVRVSWAVTRLAGLGRSASVSCERRGGHAFPAGGEQDEAETGGE